jgi:hypothetical protein
LDVRVKVVEAVWVEVLEDDAATDLEMRRDGMVSSEGRNADDPDDRNSGCDTVIWLGGLELSG